MTVPTINVTARNNCDGVWVRDVSSIAAVEPSIASATWRIQVRAAAGDSIAVLDIPRTHGSISFASNTITVTVPLAVMSRLPAGAYVWDGVYSTADGRTVAWFEGMFTVEQGVTR